jgi:hypothetical protein
LPFSPWYIPNFPVSPGDQVSVDIFVADENGQTWFSEGDVGGLTARNNSVWFMIYNDTQGAVFWGTLPRTSETLGGQSNTGFGGSTAEFILERAGSNNALQPLAPFGGAWMWNCWYGDSQSGLERLWQLGTTPFGDQVNYLNMVNQTNNDLLAVALVLPDLGSPGGSEIFWVWINSQ